jgi:EAL domain-containing protein (putative c-di-GMP-specific phosphodiesterase class I)
MEIDLTKAITGDIISMAHKMGHCVVAEGVEWDVQKQYLIANGCDKIQGFLVSKPLHEQEALELLNNQSEK